MAYFSVATPRWRDWQLAEGLDLSAFWTTEEFATLLAEPTTGLTDENAVVEPAATDIVRGDLFTLGPHRLLCGDATSPADVARLLDGATPHGNRPALWGQLRPKQRRQSRREERQERPVARLRSSLTTNGQPGG